MYLVGNFTNPGSFVLDFLEGTCAVAKACLLPRNTVVYILGKYDDCFQFSKEIIVELYARQLLY